MLLELRVENLLLIDRAELRFGPGLNAITGETGAGKTVLAHALDLLLGGKARGAIVRPGAAEAYAGGVCALPEAPPAARGAPRAPGGGRGGVRPARGAPRGARRPPRAGCRGAGAGPPRHGGGAHAGLPRGP